MVHFGAYFAQFYGLDVEKLLFVHFMFYSGMFYNFTVLHLRPLSWIRHLYPMIFIK